MRSPAHPNGNHLARPGSGTGPHPPASMIVINDTLTPRNRTTRTGASQPARLSTLPTLRKLTRSSGGSTEARVDGLGARGGLELLPDRVGLLAAAAAWHGADITGDKHD